MQRGGLGTLLSVIGCHYLYKIHTCWEAACKRHQVCNGADVLQQARAWTPRGRDSEEKGRRKEGMIHDCITAIAAWIIAD